LKIWDHSAVETVKQEQQKQLSIGRMYVSSGDIFELGSGAGDGMG